MVHHSEIPIALYGKSYIPAAKDTWRLFKDRGIDALVNDSLVSMSASNASMYTFASNLLF